MSELSKNLSNVARYWAGEITKLAKAGAPEHLKDNIKTSRQEVSPGVFSLTTTVVADDAAAQEYGSGERVKDRRRKRGKYIIKPKNQTVLAFPWQKLAGVPDNTYFGGPKLIKKDGKGKAVFHYVEHPGIHPYKNVGYVGPAFRMIRKRAKKDLDPAVYRSIFGDLNKALKPVGRR